MYNSNGSSSPILMHFTLLSFTAGMSRGAPQDPGGQHEAMMFDWDAYAGFVAYMDLYGYEVT